MEGVNVFGAVSRRWSTEYFLHEQKQHEQENKQAKLRPAVVGASLTVLGRIVVAPILLVVLLARTDYLSTATVLKEVKDSYVTYTQQDNIMQGGCVGCIYSCRTALLQYSTFGKDALLSKPDFEALHSQKVFDYNLLSPEALAYADELDAGDALCLGGINEWGTPTTIVKTHVEEILGIVNVLGLNLAPQMKLELEEAVENKDNCVSLWGMVAHLRLFKFQTVKDSADYSNVPAADLNVFPVWTDCRPNVPLAGITGSKLAYATGGYDLLTVVPDLLTKFPYAFVSSLPEVSREIAAKDTIYGVTTVLQPLFRGYYGGCRVREVNTTGVFIEDACTPNDRWAVYGLMIQAPDDIPVCSTDDVCIHHNYNSLWECLSWIDQTVPDRVGVIVNTFRVRFADALALNVLPAMVTAQILVMGIISLYQTMSHKQSFLLTQIWAYKCQNGRMQVLYLAQITYHLMYNSNSYYLGLLTGTLTVESVANLVCCFFAFAYAFVNLVHARSGEQLLDRYFRLTWELLLLITTTVLATVLFKVRTTSLYFIMNSNAVLLRKTSREGFEICVLNDSCLVFTYNLIVVISVAAIALGLVAVVVSRLLRCIFSRELGEGCFKTAKTVSVDTIGPAEEYLTSFERHCLGGKFSRLFQDCGDFAYMRFQGKNCTTVEALLLSGYLFYGQHIYIAPSVLMLLVSRLLPHQLIRTFNVLLIRWSIDLDDGTITYPQSCTWFDASYENYRLSPAMPLA